MREQPAPTGNDVFPSADRTVTDTCPATVMAETWPAAACVERFPDPTDWTRVWPVRIFTLGRFAILIDGQQPDFGRKSPQRPLSLLKALIAFGGRRINCGRLAAALWPDADGDTARKAFDTTLYRLRRLLGHEHVLVCTDGTLSLDARYCWVDAWAFERLIGQTRRALRDSRHELEPAVMRQACEHLFRLYQSHFLQQDDNLHWSVSMRERLRSKFIHYLRECGAYWERRIQWQLALDCYQKGLEVDDLIEVFYQRIMVCQLELDQISEGMATYRRCRLILSVSLGLRPETRTEQIHDELAFARRHC
jgi:DNA-binding SARP family transcriptional activator